MSIRAEDLNYRTLSSIVDCSKPSSNAKPKSVDERLGLKHHPLILIEPDDDVVIDILHLMLRVTDILERNIMIACVHQDRLTRRKGNKENLNKLISTIRSIGE